MPDQCRHSRSRGGAKAAKRLCDSFVLTVMAIVAVVLLERVQAFDQSRHDRFRLFADAAECIDDRVLLVRLIEKSQQRCCSLAALGNVAQRVSEGRATRSDPRTE